MNDEVMGKKASRDAAAWKFVILLGLVSLFADATYEGARSITGPYLAMLGASATVIGVVAGLGEFIGYAVRLLSGVISDRLQKHWLVTAIGYAINLLAVPALALAGNWQVAFVLILCERLGKAIRTPSRDAMLSYAAETVGSGKSFGLHEAMDQIGAVGGPLIVFAILASKLGYSTAFAWLAVPACAAFVCLAIAFLVFPTPEKLAVKKNTVKDLQEPRLFWIYLAFISFVAAGFVDYPLIAFHMIHTMKQSAIVAPLFYSAAMFVAAVAALVFGHWFDKKGPVILLAMSLLAALAPCLAFSEDLKLIFLGVIFWGMSLGALESVARASVGLFVTAEKRASAYGLFGLFYGLFWFLGSMIMGLLYDKERLLLVVFSVVCQLVSLPLLLIVSRQFKNEAK